MEAEINRRCVHPNQLDIEQIVLEAQNRWLRPAEICEILSNHYKFRIAPEPAYMPPSGSLFLFDRKVMRYFRKDGHNWRKKKDGKTVREAHERLKAGSVDVLHCYYAHGEENENFQRRTYWMLEEELSHIVLVHYREVKGTKSTFRCAKENEESHPYAQQTYKIMPNTERETSLSSSLHPHSYQVPSQTIDTSMNSAQASEYEEAESAFSNQASSDDLYSFLELHHPAVEKIKAQLTDSQCPLPLKDGQEKLPVIPGVNYIPLSQANKAEDINNVGLTYETSKLLGFSSWEDILENNGGSHHVPFQPSFPETQPSNMGINSNFSQGDEIMGQYVTISIAKKHENGSLTQAEGNWQAAGFNSLSTSNWPIDSMYSGSTCEASYSNCEQEVDIQNSLEQFLLHPHKQHKVLMRNGPHEKLLKAKDKLKSDLEANRSLDGIEDTYFTSKKTLLDISLGEEGLKKLDSFNQWMSKELGDVEESNKQSTSGTYWDTVESENGVGNTTIPSQVHLDTYVLDPSISHDQLFSIIDYSPSCTFEGSEIKVIISGRFLRSQHEAEHCKWSCMFGEVEVPAEIIGNGVLCCHTPPHKAGRVPFYVTHSNRLACSEVREFDFQVNYAQEVNTACENRGSSTFDTFSIRFGELLSLENPFPQSFDSISSLSERSELRGKISSLLRREDDEWDKLLKLTLEKDFSPELVQEQLLQNLLKDKLHAWLLEKTTEDGKGPNVLDEGGQGVLHFAAALGYDWALEPTIVAGVNVNFRDVNGWTALHWAAFCGRERTVASLISLGAAPGALTDPCPEHPSSRTPSDLASANGHKGIAGYLAESFLSAQLKSLDLNRNKGESLGAKATQRVQEQNTAQVHYYDEGLSYELSLKDSLAAVCNATQAAARIHQVFRVQSFHRKQLKEYGDDEHAHAALSLAALNAKPHKFGQRNEPAHVAATRIQNKFRGWKGRKEFLMLRQRVVKIQAHVRGHQVRKNYGKIIWSVGILEKVILRWRRKGSGLRGFKSEAIPETEGTTMVQGGGVSSAAEDDYDFLKEGRKQTEKRLEKALERVKSMVQYPEARDQYHRLLNVVTEIQENQVKQDVITNNSEETGEFDNLVDLEALLDDDIFMPTAT